MSVPCKNWKEQMREEEGEGGRESEEMERERKRRATINDDYRSLIVK